MTTRRRFMGEFKARVAVEALRGDKTVQEIASKHKVHPNQVSPSYSPNLDDFRAWATLFGGTRGPRRRTRSGSALMFLFGWQALGVTKQGWDAAARGSGTSGRKAASEQFEETGVGAGRWQPDANAGLSFDHAGGDLEQAQA